MFHRLNYYLVSILCLVVSPTITLLEFLANGIPFVLFEQWPFEFSGYVVDALYKFREDFAE